MNVFIFLFNITSDWNSMFVYTNLFKLDCEMSIFAYVNHAWIHSWNQPVLTNENKVSCPRKQREPLMDLELTTDRHSQIMSQKFYPLCHRRNSLKWAESNIFNR